MRDGLLAGFAAGLLAAGVLALPATSPAAAAEGRYGFGTPATPEELARFFAIPPDGRGLPPGRGTVARGATVFAEQCVACHGEKLEGIPTPGIGGDKLIGGRGSLATKTPVKTVESYWPYATTLFDYVKRAMPFSAPGSLPDDDVYAVVAYILSQAKIIGPDDTLDATTLPKVAMPNRDGFFPDPRPERRLYR
ncbi:c-type cytochrome [Rhodoplanes serenus]|jgi:cytochrome c|uniref:C-type cytochrome n=1 Tax=Rhodoplanes serenus TaxID=200615 RepID=A0A327JSL9_9BRAD|nr:cytochrome c [Rhodoplanes serenus]MBI5113506.1 cytochrome c [Rhodovulum sp.]MTW16085.1 c-type cytochrome [Rhodoplanes serenus]RAI29247.1 cytochrome C [Rhodoplanes serenus]